MTENIVVPQPQNPAGGETPNVEQVSVPKGDFEQLLHKAEVSSQNFERLKKAEEELEKMESELRALKSNSVPSVPDDNGRWGEIKSELDEVRTKLNKAEVLEQFPDLRDKWQDLEEFRNLPENKGMQLKTAAKAFLVEKGFLEPQRKGLEKQTSGQRSPVLSGMSADDLKTLRETNFKKYRDMLKSGQISVAQ